ncbi:MAG: hypothetical protein KY460_10360 [Actinobacteria bacterium]|nr:hypothetical protein [Actinomycetota bacterium]
MHADGGELSDDTAPVPERSGPKVDAAVDEAADGEGGGVLRPPAQSQPGTAPVEPTADDDMTEGQSVGTGDGGDGDPPVPPEAPPQEAARSGGMQSDPGARVPDRTAATPDED